jgi:type IV pilus assembly protein PilY1
MLNFIIIAAMSVCLMADNVHAVMSEYCRTPPFITAPAVPNVLLSVDTSGSMGWKAHSYGGVAYDPTKVYEGYFDPEKYYMQNADNVYEEAPGSCPAVCPSILI